MLLALLQWNMKNPKNLTFISARGPLTIMASRILGRNTTIPIIFYHDKHCILKLLSLLIDDWMTGGPYAPIYSKVKTSIFHCEIHGKKQIYKEQKSLIHDWFSALKLNKSKNFVRWKGFLKNFKMRGILTFY